MLPPTPGLAAVRVRTVTPLAHCPAPESARAPRTEPSTWSPGKETQVRCDQAKQGSAVSDRSRPASREPRLRAPLELTRFSSLLKRPRSSSEDPDVVSRHGGHHGFTCVGWAWTRLCQTARGRRGQGSCRRARTHLVGRPRRGQDGGLRRWPRQAGTHTRVGLRFIIVMTCTPHSLPWSLLEHPPLALKTRQKELNVTRLFPHEMHFRENEPLREFF